MKIFDAHNDFFTELNSKQIASYLKHLKLYHKNVKIISQVWTTELNNPIKFINKCNKIISISNNLCLGIEDLGFINEDNLKMYMNKIIELRPISCGIVWNYDNALGGGALGKSGLTSIGEKVVKRLERNNVIIDTAHMNRKTFFDFCKITTKPIFNSHCNIYELHHHKRNIDEEQICKIISTNGLICLSFVGNFISGKNISSKEVALQIYYAIYKYGYKHFAIGSDFFGTNNLPNNLENYLDFHNLKEELLRLGVSRKKIRAVFYKNLDRFIKKNIKR